jgi:hypothetical protein
LCLIFLLRPRGISTIATDEGLALRAHRSLPLKNTLLQEDSQAVEAAYLSKLVACSQEPSASTEPILRMSKALGPGNQEAPRETPVAPLTKAIRKRSKAHLAFVASQPCLICKSSPRDVHYLKIAQPRSLGRKVSDEFTVPLCREHHQALHRHGNEANWWANMQVAPLPIAKELWEVSPVHGPSQSLALHRLPANLL